MAQGRGIAYAAAMLLIIVGLQSYQASAATYTVGGSSGWTLGVDYTAWASGLTFKAGDILFFPYAQSEHNVVVVDKAGYDACSEANAVTTYSAGNTSVTLSGTGAHYYLCSVVGHCAGGMKLAVTVTATAAAPASPPASAKAPTATPLASASAPSKTPSSSPITPPSTAPSPTSPPSSAAPSVETPASVPSPSSAPASTPTAGTPASSPTAPGSTPSTAAPPSPPPPPPNSAPSRLVSASFAPLLALFATLLAL